MGLRRGIRATLAAPEQALDLRSASLKKMKDPTCDHTYRNFFSHGLMRVARRFGCNRPG